MSDWQLELFDRTKNRKTKKELSTGTYILGRSREADIFCNCQTASRRHARLEVRTKDVLLTDLGSANGTYVNGKRIYQTTVLQAGGHFKIGSTDYVLQQRANKQNEEVHLSLYFASRNQRKKLVTLPYFIGYDNSNKTVFGTTDPYREGIDLKIDLDQQGVFCRNISGNPDFLYNNKRFQTINMNHGDKLSTPGEDIIFESGFGSLTGFSEFDSGADELKTAKSYKPKLVLAVLALIILFVSYFVYHLNKQEKWQKALTESIELYSQEAKAYDHAFAYTTDVQSNENKFLVFIEPYREPYSNLRNNWIEISSNSVASAGMSLLMPQVKRKMNDLFSSLDKIFEFRDELAQAIPTQQKWHRFLIALTDTTSKAELKKLREYAGLLQPIYASHNAIIKQTLSISNQLKGLNSYLSQVAELDFLLRFEEQLNERESILQKQNDAFIKLEHLSSSLLQVIPE